MTGPDLGGLEGPWVPQEEKFIILFCNYGRVRGQFRGFVGRGSRERLERESGCKVGVQGWGLGGFLGRQGRLAPEVGRGEEGNSNLIATGQMWFWSAE